MKIAIEIFVSLFILIMTIAICVGLISSDLEVMEARDCYYSCVSELQESNFADKVAQSCIENAARKGYPLYIDIYETADGDRSANVKLIYKYELAPLGIAQEKTIESLIN